MDVAVIYPTIGLDVDVSLVPSKYVSESVENDELLVPPFAIPRIPVMSVVRLTSAFVTAPAVAFKKPEIEPSEKLEVNRFVDDAVVANELVEVLLVMSLFAPNMFVE